MIEYIPELVSAGITSLKIEGRMKSSFYVASIVKAYREAVDSYFENPAQYKFNPKWMEYLTMISHRNYHTGFYFGEKNKQIYETSSYIRGYDIVGIVKEYKDGIAVIEQRNKVCEGDQVEVMRAKGDNLKVTLKNMRDSEGNKIEAAPSAQMIFTINTDEKLEKDDMLIKNKEEK